ncbi:cytochrome b/b6 domain-containing protein [Ferribacterium limneticum]|uniref:cytochrome b/b6 domain-containing protein n=1 Tax=Ferribacterium limneticum TaxID=76259 RepID=UPI001CF92904|nr:cytochrome b/b6 domain-containing protein [Ferribacterium limneticum]UCV22061.1 cytochrome b/b6 domain-containing protein [Ferribacterium limneticum]
MNSQRIRLWDLPTRLFHWLLALAVIAAIVSGQLGGKLIDLHGKIGLAIIGLIAFRIVWGFAGSTYARFAQFFPTPAKIKVYLKGEWRGVGHNPLGGLSVFSLIFLLTVQVLSGLFANDDIAFVGPLFELIDKSLSDRLSGIHELLSNVLIALVVLHVVAVAFHGHFKKDNLVKPMITGWKEGVSGESAKGGGMVALVVAVSIAGAVVYGASGAWLPEPPPLLPAVETPSW